MKKPSRGLLAPVLLAVALASGAASARADEVAEAKAHLRRGAELYRAGKWRAAIGEFEEAYRLKPHGAIHFNVAQCRERLGEWPGALRAYHDYLREVPEAKDRAAVRAAIHKIEGRLAAAGAQALLVYSDPPGAELRVEGRARGKTPLHTVLPPGSYSLALALDGYEPVTQDVTVAPDVSRVVDLVLRPAGPARPPAVAAPAPAPAPPPAVAARPGQEGRGPAPDLTVKPPAPSSPVGAKAPERPRERRRVYTWVAAGTAVAAVAAGAYFGWSARQDANDVPGIVNDGARARRTASDAQSKARTANVLYAVSGGAAAAGITLFFVERKF